jgi:hypothetical protein
VVISVSYRIGPFHQFPAAIHDAEDVLSAILDSDGVSNAGKVLRTELQRYYGMMRSDEIEKTKKAKKAKKPAATHLNDLETITLDPTRLAISGFSAGGYHLPACLQFSTIRCSPGLAYSLRSRHNRECCLSCSSTPRSTRVSFLTSAP